MVYVIMRLKVRVNEISPDETICSILYFWKSDINHGLENTSFINLREI